MKTEIAQRLSAALRSGEFTQTKGTLNRTIVQSKDLDDKPYPVGHCCLGVLSELAVQDGIIEKRPNDSYGDRCSFGTPDEFDRDDYATSLPPTSVGDWAGLVYNKSEWEPTIMFDVTGHEGINHKKIYDSHKYGDRILVAAHELNDEHDFTFEMIADLIDSGKIVTELPERKDS